MDIFHVLEDTSEIGPTSTSNVPAEDIHGGNKVVDIVR